RNPRAVTASAGRIVGRRWKASSDGPDGRRGGPCPSRGELSLREGKAWFTTTHWSVVLKARSPDDIESRDALATLGQAYWSPVFLYIKHRGHDAEAARDLTQGFFAALLEKDGMLQARKERGRFRSFLLTAVKNFLANQHDLQSAQKRGGGQAPISIDA